MNKRYKPIPGFNMYKISRSGKIYSLYSKRLISFHFNKKGYVRVRMTNNFGVSKLKFVHILVGLVWVPNPENKPEINHKNKIRHDNRSFNLEWSTRSENMLHSWADRKKLTLNI